MADVDARVPAPGFTPAVVRRLIMALLADELGRRRGRACGPEVWTRWGDATRLDEEPGADDACLGADSLQRLELVARVNRFFHLHETGAEDYLVISPTLGGWAEVVAASLALKAERVTFETSGSTGAPKPVEHALADLAAEVDAHAALTPDARRVVALTPPHHIYGFLWGCWGPALRGLPVLDGRAWGPGRAAREAGPGDLIVATPFQWGLMLRAGARFATGATGVSSGAPAPPALWRALADAGLPRLLEIYGASETAGLGWRDAPDAPFAPMAHVAADGEGLRRRRDGAMLDAPDHVAWEADGRFRPSGRRDGAVQVGGVNVRPERVRDVLLAHPDVADCAIRLDGAGPDARLKGFVVPRGESAALDEALAAHCAARLSPPERPVRFTFGPALPRTEIGKAADWP